ncbi:anoctamin-3-like isoform X3 [Cherax quadricarinatus]|uniref:anoctamin-3-like isoform X3 n=1 Tax=Cherax quadricarinatus TaxID=27406 RepID=UPI00387E4C38
MDPEKCVNKDPYMPVRINSLNIYETRDILRSLRRLTSATASIESVYYSTTELHDPGEMSDLDAELITDRNDIIMDDLNGQPPNKPKEVKKNPQLYLNDGIHSIDYILVSRDSETDDHLDHEEWRRVFEKNLVKEGLILEEDRVEEVPLRFVKIHAPFEVCTRYAEILKLRMPMKEVRRVWLGSRAFISTLLTISCSDLFCVRQ